MNKVDMVVRNIRPRYPMSSAACTDQMDEVYKSLVDILGYQNVSGTIATSGVLRSMITIVESERARTFGSPASGYDDAFILGSGYMDSMMCSGNMLSAELLGYWSNPF